MSLAVTANPCIPYECPVSREGRVRHRRGSVSILLEFSDRSPDLRRRRCRIHRGRPDGRPFAQAKRRTRTRWREGGELLLEPPHECSTCRPLRASHVDHRQSDRPLPNELHRGRRSARLRRVPARDAHERKPGRCAVVPRGQPRNAAEPSVAKEGAVGGAQRGGELRCREPLDVLAEPLDAQEEVALSTDNHSAWRRPERRLLVDKGEP